MEPELADLIKVAVRTLVESMTTDGWNAARARFVKLVTRRKRGAVEARLDTARQRVRGAPDERAEAADRLADELGPMLDARHLTLAQLNDFIASFRPLIEASKPVITANAAVVEGDQLIFNPPRSGLVIVPESGGQPNALSELSAAEHAGMLRETTRALKETAAMLKDSAAAQRKLTDEVVAQTRIAQESQKEADAARLTVLRLLVMMAGLRRHLEDVTCERDNLLDQLNEALGQEARVAELQRELVAAQQEVRRSDALYRRSERQLALTRERQHRAERVAEDALGRLARYESASGTTDYEQPDADEYEQVLDGIAADGKVHDDRLSEIEEALDKIASPFRPDSAKPPAAREELKPGAVRVKPPASRETTGSGALAAIGVLAGFLAIGLVIALVALIVVRSVQDNSYSLTDLHMTGTKPIATTYTPPCYEMSCGGAATEYLTYALRPGRTVRTTYQVSDNRERYLNASLSLQDIGRSCGNAASVSYAVYSDGRLAGYGTVTAASAPQISDVPIGKHAQLALQATLRAPGGCALTLQLTNPTVDALKGWSWTAQI